VLDVEGRSFEADRDLHFLDLHMLVVFGGRERTFEEYDALLGAAAFPPARLAVAGRSWDVIEAVR
jgi:hypothetical protein